MNDYFIPLKTLIPPLALPGIGVAAEKVGIRDFTESWTETHISMEGTGVIDGEVVLPFGGFELVLGEADQSTTFHFLSSSGRRSVIRTLFEEGMESLIGPGKIDETTPEEDIDPPVLVMLKLDALPERSRTVVSGATLKLRLPREHAKRAQKVDVNGVERLEKLVPDAPVDITVGSVVLTYDSIDGISVSVPPSNILETPPFFIADSEIGVEIHDVKIDVQADKGIPDVLSRPGYDETWKGVWVGQLTIWGLDRQLPFLPSKIAATNWICGTDGWSGALDVETFPNTDPESTWILQTIGIELDRGSLVRGTVGARFRVGQIHTALADVGSNGELELRFSLRHNPALSGVEAWGWEIALLTPGKDNGLISLDAKLLAGLVPSLPVIILTALGLSGDVGTLPLVLLSVLAALQTIPASSSPPQAMMRLDLVRLDTLRFRSFAENRLGTVVRFIDVVMDVQTKLSLDFNIPVILVAKTSRPIGVDFKGITLRWSLQWDSFSEALQKDLGARFNLIFEPEGGVTFDLSEQAIVQNSVIEFFRFGVGQWERGLWFDIGARTTKKITDGGAIGATGRFFFLTDGTYSHCELQGIGVTVYVPGALYLYADLGWSEIKSVYTDALILQKNPLVPPTPTDATNPLGWIKPRREDWRWALTTLLQWQTIKDGTGHELQSLVAGIELSIDSGIPLGSSGVSIFGFLGQYAANALPGPKADADASKTDAINTGAAWLPWFRNQEKTNSVIGPFPKWKALAGGGGFGLGLIIGSTPYGTLWNATVGATLLVPGPVLIVYGAANFLVPKPGLGGGEGAKFIAVAVFDFEEDTFTLGVTIEYDIPKDGKIIHISVPTEIYVDFKNVSGQSHIYLGKHMPMSERMMAKVLGKFQLSAYLMFDTRDIENLAGHDLLDLKGMVLAIGGRGEWKYGLEAKYLKLFFQVGLEFNAALSAPDPWYVMALIQIDGALVVKVFGFGFEFRVWAEMHAKAPSPWLIEGSVGVSIDLPWPLKDIKKTVQITIVNEGEEPDVPLDPFAAITAHLRQSNDAFDPVSTGRAVPIDAVLSLSFAFPIRSGAGGIGSLGSVLDPNDSVKFITSGDQGFVFTLTGVTLKKNGGPDKKGIPAIWRKEPVKARGGEESRVTLDLFSYQGDVTARYLGTSATYLDSTMKDWTPCKPAKKPVQVCYDFDAEAAGPVGTRTIEAAGHPSMIVTTTPAPDDTEFLTAVFGLAASQAEVIAEDVVHAARIPCTYGLPDEAFPIEISEALSFRFERGRDIEVHCLQHLQRSEQPILRFYDGNTLVHTATHPSSGEVPVFVYSFAGPATHVELTSRTSNVTTIGGLRQPSDHGRVLVQKICLHYESELAEYEQAKASGDEWKKFWTDLLEQAAAAPDELLLDPASEYELTVTVTGARLDGSGSVARKRVYAFTTESLDRPLRPLRPRNLQLAEEEDHAWEIDAFPSDGTFAMYTNRPIRLRFANARVETIFAKFGEKLVLRIIDAKGVDLFETIEKLQLTAKTLPEYQQQWKKKVTEAPCTPNDPALESFWAAGEAVFALLETDRDYFASLHVMPAGFDGFLNAKWTDHPSVYSFKFRTSRWENLAKHAAAYEIYDEILDGAPDPAAIAEHAGAASGIVTGDQILDRIVFDDLQLPFRNPPRETPEVVRLWHKSGDAYQLAGVLLDGPEPLVRAEGSGLTIALDGSAIEHLCVNGTSGARALLLFAAPLPSSLLITVTDAYLDKDNTGKFETASIAIDLPAMPPPFEEEPAP